MYQPRTSDICLGQFFEFMTGAQFVFDGLRHLNAAGYFAALHSAGRVYGVAPDVVIDLPGSNDPGNG